MLLILTLAFLSVSPKAIALENLEGNTDIFGRISAIAGLNSYHDGPNCYNGAAMALGFTNSLRHTTAFEFRLYLEFFCEPQLANSQFGDVAIVERQGVLEHAMVMAPSTNQSSRYFQKENLIGSLGKYSDYPRAENFYKYGFKKIENSRYVQNCGEDCEIKFLRCQPPAEVMPEIKRCQNLRVYKEAEFILNKLEVLSLTPERLRSESLAEIISLANQSLSLVESISPTSPCAIYYLAQWVSIDHSIYFLAEELNLPHSGLTKTLEKVKEKLETFSTEPRLPKILKEFVP